MFFSDPACALTDPGDFYSPEVAPREAEQRRAKFVQCSERRTAWGMALLVGLAGGIGTALILAHMKPSWATKQTWYKPVGLVALVGIGGLMCGNMLGKWLGGSSARYSYDAFVMKYQNNKSNYSSYQEYRAQQIQQQMANASTTQANALQENANTNRAKFVTDIIGTIANSPLKL